MKICLVSQEYPPDTARGGIGTQTWNKARALAARGHSVCVLASAMNPGPDPQVILHDGVTVYRIQPPGAAFPVYTDAAFWIGYSWAVLLQLTRLNEANSFDVLDFAEYGGEGFAYLLDRTPWNWMPTVVQLHGPLSMFAERIGWPLPDTDLFRVGTMMEHLCIQRADGLMACSANIAEFVAAHHGVSRQAIEVVHCGVDARAFNAEERDAHEDSRPTVLFVGNIAKSKGVYSVLEAVLALREAYPDIRLILLGKTDSNDEQAIIRYAAEHGGRTNVEYAGFAGRDELPSYYARAHVFCSPAEHEAGVANVYLEAMASGCPVVAATTGAASEAIIDGECGVLVPPDDAVATARALDLLLSNAILRRRMGRAGRHRVESYFDMEHYIDRVLGVYERAIAQAGTKRNRLLEGA